MSEPVTAAAPSGGRVAPLLPELLAHHTSCVLVKVGQAVYRLMEQRLAGLGLRIRHYSILQTLVRLGPRSQQDLSDYLRIDPATMVASIDHVEHLGLVSRVRDPADRRRYVVTVTAAGRATARETDKLLDALDDELLGDLSATARAQLHRHTWALAAGDALTAALDASRGRPPARTGH